MCTYPYSFLNRWNSVYNPHSIRIYELICYIYERNHHYQSCISTIKTTYKCILWSRDQFPKNHYHFFLLHWMRVSFTNLYAIGFQTKPYTIWAIECIIFGTFEFVVDAAGIIGHKKDMFPTSAKFDGCLSIFNPRRSPAGIVVLKR